MTTAKPKTETIGVTPEVVAIDTDRVTVTDNSGQPASEDCVLLKSFTAKTNKKRKPTTKKVEEEKGKVESTETEKTDAAKTNKKRKPTINKAAKRYSTKKVEEEKGKVESTETEKTDAAKVTEGTAAEPAPETEPVKIVGTTEDGQPIIEVAVEAGKSDSQKGDANLPDVTRSTYDPEKVRDFKSRIDLQRAALSALATGVYKSKVLGDMIRDFAYDGLAFIDEVLNVTTDTKYIEYYFDNSSMKYNDEANYGRSDKLLEKLINMEPELDVLPNDIDSDLVKQHTLRATASSRKFMKYIEAETFSAGSMAERVQQVVNWAIENPLFFTMEGPEGCEIGYCDCDGTFYGPDKKVFVPKDDGNDKVA